MVVIAIFASLFGGVAATCLRAPAFLVVAAAWTLSIAATELVYFHGKHWLLFAVAWATISQVAYWVVLLVSSALAERATERGETLHGGLRSRVAGSLHEIAGREQRVGKAPRR